jgi:hypothetical protein
MDITIEAHTGAPDDANIFVYNLTRDYEKIGIPQGVVYKIDLSNLSDTTPTASICYALTGETAGGHGSDGKVKFSYEELTDGCVDNRFVFCPLSANPSGSAITDKNARWQCLNGTLPNQAYFNSIIDAPIPPCSDAIPAAYGLPSPAIANHLLSHNELYLCNQTPKSYVELCWPLMLIFGLLMGASFLLGRNPFMAFDLSSPRLGRGKQYSMRVQQERRDLMSYAMAGDQAVTMAGKGRDALRAKDEVGRTRQVFDKKTGKFKNQKYKSLEFSDKKGASNWSLFGLLTRATEKIAGSVSKGKEGRLVKGIARGPEDSPNPTPEDGFSTRYSPSSTSSQSSTKQGGSTPLKPTTAPYKPPLNVATSLSASLFTAPGLLNVGRIISGNRELRKEWRKEADLMLKEGGKWLTGWQFFALVAKMIAQNMGITGKSGRLEVLNKYDLMTARSGIYEKIADGLKFLLEVYSTLNAATKLYAGMPGTESVIDFAKIPGLKMLEKMRNKGPSWLRISQGRQFSLGEVADMIAEPNNMPYGSQWLAPIMGVVRDKAGALLTPAPEETNAQFVKIKGMDGGEYNLVKGAGFVSVFDSKGREIKLFDSDGKPTKQHNETLREILRVLRDEAGEVKVGKSIFDVNGFDKLFTAFMEKEGLKNSSLGKIYVDDAGKMRLKKIGRGEFEDLAARQIAWNNSQNKLDNYILEALRPKFGDEFVTLKDDEIKLLNMLDATGGDPNALQLLKGRLSGRSELDAESITSLRLLKFDENEINDNKGNVSYWDGKISKMIELVPYTDEGRVRLSLLNGIIQNRNSQNMFLQSMIDSDYEKEGKAKLLADIDNYYYLRQTANMSVEAFRMMDANMNGGLWSNFAYWTQMRDKERKEEAERIGKLMEGAEKEINKSNMSNDPIEWAIQNERFQKLKAMKVLMDSFTSKLDTVPDDDSVKAAYATLTSSVSNQTAYRNEVSSIVLSDLQQGLDAGKLGSLLVANSDEVGRFGQLIGKLEQIKDAKLKEAVIEHYHEALDHLSQTSQNKENAYLMQTKLSEIESMAIVLTGMERGTIKAGVAAEFIRNLGLISGEAGETYSKEVLNADNEYVKKYYVKKATYKFKEAEYDVLDDRGNTVTKTLSGLDASDYNNGNLELIQSQIALQTVESYKKLIGKGYLTDAGNISFEMDRVDANVHMYAANIERFARDWRASKDEDEKLRLNAQLDITSAALNDDLQAFYSKEERLYSTSQKYAKKTFYENWRAWIDAPPFMRDPAADVLENITGVRDIIPLVGFGVRKLPKPDPYEVLSLPNPLTGVGRDAPEVLKSNELLDSKDYQEAIAPSRISWISKKNYEEEVEKIKDSLRSRTLLSSTESLPEDVKAHLKKMYDDLTSNPAYQGFSYNDIHNTVMDPLAMVGKFIEVAREEGYTDSQIRLAANWLEDEVKRRSGDKKSD